MSDYTRVYDFSVKDGLSSGNPAKKIKGSEVDGELDAAVVSSATKTDKVSGATTNNLAGLDNNGNLQDAGGSILDEDDMVSDSDTDVASQQSVKAYADSMGIESGSVLVFYQAAAPTGYTILTTPDDCVLTVDDENGGTTGGSGDITAGITSSVEAAHTHLISGTTSVINTGTEAEGGSGDQAEPPHSHTVNFTSGAGSGHTHSTSAKYAKCILATKD